MVIGFVVSGYGICSQWLLKQASSLLSNYSPTNRIHIKHIKHISEDSGVANAPATP